MYHGDELTEQPEKIIYFFMCFHIHVCTTLCMICMYVRLFNVPTYYIHKSIKKGIFVQIVPKLLEKYESGRSSAHQSLQRGGGGGVT